MVVIDEPGELGPASARRRRRLEAAFPRIEGVALSEVDGVVVLEGHVSGRADIPEKGVVLGDARLGLQHADLHPALRGRDVLVINESCPLGRGAAGFGVVSGRLAAAIGWIFAIIHCFG